MIRLVIIEDDKIIRSSLKSFASFQEDIEVVGDHDSVEQYLSAQQTDTTDSDILLLDISLRGMSGLDGIPFILDLPSPPSIVMLSTYEEFPKIQQAMQSGAKAYLSKRTKLPQIMDGIRKVYHEGSYVTPLVERALAG